MYRDFRESDPRPLEELFRDPDAAAHISLLPVRWGVDAVIIFQDILTPLSGMGAPFVFRPGPQPETPLTNTQDFERLHRFDMADGLPFLARLYELLRGPVTDAGLPLLGFAGAPFTLFAFLAENGSPPFDLPNTRALMREYPVWTRTMLDLLADMTTDYLAFQIGCGANAVQLFESAAHCLTLEEYSAWALPGQQRVFAGIRNTGVPTILFARRDDALLAPATLHAAGASILSLPAAYSIATVRAEIGEPVPIQGNLDNHLLAAGPPEAIIAAAQHCIEEGACHGHIFNLGHGVLPDTPFEHVTLLIDAIRSFENTNVE